MKRASILGLCVVLVSAASPTAMALYDCVVTGARDQAACCCPAGEAGGDPALPCARDGATPVAAGLSAPPRPCCEVRYDPAAPASSPGPAVASPGSRLAKLFDRGLDGAGSVSIASPSAALAALAARPDDAFAIGPPGPELHLLACSLRC